MTKNKQKQQGIVLVLSLIILLAMTLIGVSGMQSTSLEGIVAGNLRDKDLSLKSSNSALVEAEQIMKSFKEEPIAVDGIPNKLNNEVWNKNAPSSIYKASWPIKPVADHDWWVSKAEDITLTTLNTSIYSEQPRFIIEYWSFKKDSLNMGQQNDITGLNYYKITSWGVGGKAEDSAEDIKATTSIHQINYAKRF